MKYHIDFDIDFKRNPYKGLYIALEGINASGKNTQIDKIKIYLEKQGEKVVITEEPNHNLVIGKFVRNAITKGVTFPLSALQYLYTADRIINHESIIIPALKEGKVVLASRSFWSGLVYGVVDRGGKYTQNEADRLLVAQGILSMYHQFIIPDKTFYLDAKIDTIVMRMEKMHQVKDIYETREKLLELLAGYQWLVKQFPKEFSII